MALFTDGPISSIEDLLDHDTQLVVVAMVEGIDVTRKLALAQEEISIELVGLLDGVRRLRTLSEVVVTPPLKLWHTLRALEMVYRDAFHSQLNDRYSSRRDEYRGMANWAREKVMQSGLGMVTDPIPEAEMPELAATSGNLADGTYYVAMSWSNERGEEGACSHPAKISTAGSSIAVSHGATPGGVSGWNVYLGSTPGRLIRQNDAALAVGVGWTAPGVRLNGMPAGIGQAPGYTLELARVIARG